MSLAGAELDSRPSSSRRKLEVIDDLAVADDRIASVRAGDRLVAVLEVDDAEPAHAEAEIAVDEIAGVVGTAMDQMATLARDRAALRPDGRAFCTNRQFHT